MGRKSGLPFPYQSIKRSHGRISFVNMVEYVFNSLISME